MKEMQKQPTMMTIREIAGTGLMSEHALRIMLKAGKLPAIFIGKKALINYDKLCEELQALEANVAKQHMKADGIGFVIPEGYFFLDVDHQELTNPFVQMMLKRFSSYAEISPSGNGLHIYGIADMTRLPMAQDKDGKQKLDRQFYMKNPNNGIELYFGGLTNRFATFTGNVVHDVPLCDCTEAVLTTLDKDMRRSQPRNYSAKRDGDRETFDIICNLRKQKNGAKFIRACVHSKKVV